jgi:hypothetical protein
MFLQKIFFDECRQQSACGIISRVVICMQNTSGEQLTEKFSAPQSHPTKIMIV